MSDEEKATEGLRCQWGTRDADYIAYHDEEWGMPVVDEHRLFEKLCLEGFQAGLSWLTILRKRPAFRRVFANFDFDVVAGFGPSDVDRLLLDASIVRHRKKIESTIHNARRAVALREAQRSLSSYFWPLEPPPRPAPDRLPAHTPRSKAMSKDLKRLGFTFVGPTTSYAFMQAMGLVNDHAPGCPAHARCEAARTAQGVLSEAE